MTRVAQVSDHTSEPALGVRGIAFLRRVRTANGPYFMERNGDHLALDGAVRAGFVRRDRRSSDIVYLTHAGRLFLDQLMRAH